MASSGYQAWSVTAGEIPTTAFWNILGANDASFNTGNGINDSAIISRHIAAHNVTNNTYIYNEVVGGSGGSTQTIGQAWTTSANWGAGTVTTSGGDLLVHVHFTYWRTVSTNSQFRLILNGSAFYPGTNGWQQYTNELSSHKMCSRSILITGLAAATYTVGLQMFAVTSGTVNTDTADWLNMVSTEYLR